MALPCGRKSYGGVEKSEPSQEAWQCARLLRAIPSCRFVIMAAYHIMSPALSIEEANLMNYLQNLHLMQDQQ